MKRKALCIRCGKPAPEGQIHCSQCAGPAKPAREKKRAPYGTMGGKPGGMSLYEIMVSLFVMVLLMIVFADLMTRYSRTLTYLDMKDRSLANVKMGLDSVTAELEEALAVYSPDTDGAVDDEVILWRYNPEDSKKKLTERTSINALYYLDSRILFREVSLAGITTSFPVAHHIASFSVKREHQRLFTVMISLEESHKVYSLSGKACLKPGI